MNAREIVVMLPILLFIVWIGVYPKPFLNKIEKSVGVVVTKVQAESAIGQLEKQKSRDSKLALQGTMHTEHEKSAKEAQTK